MKKPLRCKLGRHDWQLSKKKYDELVCRLCGKVNDDDKPVGSFDKWWQKGGEGGEGGAV
jgi:hypothetical protein